MTCRRRADPDLLSTVTKVTPDGTATVFASAQYTGAGLSTPPGAAFDAAGNLYVATVRLHVEHVLYCYPDPSNPGHYNMNGIRSFYRFDNGQIIVK